MQKDSNETTDVAERADLKERMKRADNRIMIIFAIFGIAVTALWVASLFWTLYLLRNLKPLKPYEGQGANESEQVSIIVPARNEANRVLEKSILSMLSQDYKNLEVVVLNDCSTDNTEEILREIQKSNPRLVVVNGVEPEAGWLGKPFALEQAFRHARGEWILATDADIIFSRNAVQTAVQYAKAKNLDALTLAPKLIYGSFWERLFLPIFAWFCLLAMPPHRVNDPKRKEAMGVGNFFMFRRSVLEKIGGFSAVKSDVAEDLRMAEVLKEQGFRFRMEYAPDLIQTRMYSTLKEIWEGFTKNLFSGLKFSVSKAILSSFAILFFGVMPILLAFGFIFFGYKGLGSIFFIAYVFQVITLVPVYLRWQGNPLYALLSPLGLLLFLLILVNSTFKIISGDGVSWKERKIYEKEGVRPIIRR
ncbi:MAG: glycosyltransferase [Acidobacteria bacterium]|nr:MAG: glycosyltransferase [Acidobacteriota bacterium]